MTITSFIEVVAPRTGKIIKNGFSIFEKREHLPQNGINTLCV